MDLYKPILPSKSLYDEKVYIRMSWELHQKIKAFVTEAKYSECQWFHCIKVERSDQYNITVYTLSEMLIPEQNVGGATVESPEKGMLSIVNDLKARFNGDYDQINPILQSMHCWCHSHVQMAPQPSSTDRTTFNEWIKSNRSQGITSPVMMMIFNQRGEMYCEVRDDNHGIYQQCPEIKIIMPVVDTSDISQAIETKLKKPFNTYVGTNWEHLYTGEGKSWAGGQKKTTRTVEQTTPSSVKTTQEPLHNQSATTKSRHGGAKSTTKLQELNETSIHAMQACAKSILHRSIQSVQEAFTIDRDVHWAPEVKKNMYAALVMTTLSKSEAYALYALEKLELLTPHLVREEIINDYCDFIARERRFSYGEFLYTIGKIRVNSTLIFQTLQTNSDAAIWKLLDEIDDYIKLYRVWEKENYTKANQSIAIALSSPAKTGTFEQTGLVTQVPPVSYIPVTSYSNATEPKALSGVQGYRKASDEGESL